MWVDFLQSGSLYTRKARAIEGSDQEFDVTWTVCKPGAKPLPFPTRINSLVWANGRDVESKGVGEVATSRKQHVTSGTRSSKKGTCAVGDPAWFRNGVPRAVYDAPPATVPLCCQDIPENLGTVFLWDSSYYVVTPHADVVPSPCCPEGWPLAMTVTITCSDLPEINGTYDLDAVPDGMGGHSPVWESEITNTCGYPWAFIVECLTSGEGWIFELVQITGIHTIELGFGCCPELINTVLHPVGWNIAACPLGDVDVTIAVTLPGCGPSRTARGRVYLDQSTTCAFAGDTSGREYVDGDVILGYGLTVEGRDYVAEATTTHVIFHPTATGREYLEQHTVAGAFQIRTVTGREYVAQATTTHTTFNPTEDIREYVAQATTVSIQHNLTVTGREYVAQATINETLIESIVSGQVYPDESTTYY